MPKKFGTNTKKEEARERESQKKNEIKEKQRIKAENEYWKETDDKIIKKQEKEKEKEAKRLEAIKRKQENKALVEEEMKSLTDKNKPNKAPTKKDIEDYKERTLKKLLEQVNSQNKEEEVEEIDVEKEFINENYIKMNEIEKYTDKGIDLVDVTGVDSALQELDISEYDKHPEKRMRSAWNAFFEKKLPEYKEQYPNAKRSQLIDMIQKEFKKSPDNPVYKSQQLGLIK